MGCFSHYVNSRPSVQSWMAFCCAFPAFLLPMAQKQSCKERIYSKWSPWSAGCGSYGAKWCFVRCLQFGRNLEELAHGVSPGHADILILEHEEIAIPRPGLFLPCSAQVQLGQFAQYCGVTTGLFCPLLWRYCPLLT